MARLAGPRPAVSSRSKPLVLAALITASFAVNLDTTIVNVALPSLVRQLHATNTQLQWVVDAYNLVFAALILTFGSLSDRLGRKRLLIAGLTVFGLASVAGALTGTADQLIAARAVMGLGAAMVFPSTLSLLANIFTERGERARAIGLWGASAGAAIALGPIVGGWLLDHFSWPAIFYAMVPVAAVALGLVARFVPESRHRDPQPVDVGAFVLSTAAMGVIVYTLIEGPDQGWLSFRSVAGFAAAAVLFAAFITWERRRSAPMLDLHLFAKPRFSAASLSVTVAFFTLFGFIFLITQYFQFIKSYSPLGTGIRLLPVAITVGASSLLGTKLAVKIGTKAVVVAGMVFIAAFYFWVAASMTVSLGYGTIVAQMVLYGVGLGLTSAPATESIMGAVSIEHSGVGSAVNDATRLLGGTLGVAVIGSVFTSLYGQRLTATLPAQLPAAAKAIAHQSLGAAYTVATRTSSLGHPQLATVVHQSANGAFIHGMVVACLVAAGAAVLGAVAATIFLPAQPPAEVPEPALQ
jgi:EmrB/QacA subfamily drug resistance transporter